MPPQLAAKLLEHMPPQTAGRSLVLLPSKRGGEILARIPVLAAVAALRLLERDQVRALLAVLPRPAAAQLRLRLRYSERVIGAFVDSDVVLVAPVLSLGRGNLRGIRRLLKAWPTPITGAICLETVELGRLNYYSDGMIRGEIDCSIAVEEKWERYHKPNAILVINEVINSILKLRLPQKPRTQIVIGRIAGGFNHGKIAYEAKIGFEILSDSDDMVKELFADIGDIVAGINKAFAVELKLNRISNLSATSLRYNHPLVKCASRILDRLGIEAVSEPSETALSIFLQRQIPAITLGITSGDNFHQEGAMVEIEPMFKGIAQIPALVMAMDNGVCDE